MLLPGHFTPRRGCITEGAGQSAYGIRNTLASVIFAPTTIHFEIALEYLKPGKTMNLGPWERYPQISGWGLQHEFWPDVSQVDGESPVLDSAGVAAEVP
jgi:hypothetical protein